VLVMLPVELEPLVDLLPDQAPEAVHAVALVEDQVRVELVPLETLLGLALNVTVGVGCAAAIETVTDFAVEAPPAPVQVKV
jgi:hypothetical protein